MQTIKTMIAGILLLFAVLFAIRISTNLNSTDPKGKEKAGADVFIAVVCGIGAVALIKRRSES